MRRFIESAALLALLLEPAFAQSPAACVPVLSADPELVRRYDALILRHAEKSRLNPRLVKAIIAVESQFAPRAVSFRGARGLMQLMPATAREMGVAPRTLSDPDANIRAGTKYLAVLFSALRRGDSPAGRRSASWEVRRVIAAYNAGPGALTRDAWPASTRRYVRAVWSCYRSDASVLALAAPVAPRAGERGREGVRLALQPDVPLTAFSSL